MASTKLSTFILPDLVEIQRASFCWFLEEGLAEEIKSPSAWCLGCSASPLRSSLAARAPSADQGDGARHQDQSPNDFG